MKDKTVGVILSIIVIISFTILIFYILPQLKEDPVGIDCTNIPTDCNDDSCEQWKQCKQTQCLEGQYLIIVNKTLECKYGYELID